MPRIFPVPVALTDVACTEASLQRRAIVPVYVPEKATVTAVGFGVGVSVGFGVGVSVGFGVGLGVGLILVNPAGHLGFTAVTFFTIFPL